MEFAWLIVSSQGVTEAVKHEFNMVGRKFNVVGHKFNMVGHKFNVVGHDWMLYKQKQMQQLRTNTTIKNKCNNKERVASA